MSLNQMWRQRDLKWWAVALLLSMIVGAIGAGAAAIITGRQTKTYESTAVLTIDQPLFLALSANPDYVTKLSVLRVKYTGIATTLTYAKLVAKHSGLPVAEIAGHIVSTATAGNLLIVVGAEGTDPTLTRRIAQAAAATMPVYVNRNQASVPHKFWVHVNVVTPALGAVQVAPSHTKEVGSVALAGIVLFGLALSVQTLRIRQPDSV